MNELIIKIQTLDEAGKDRSINVMPELVDKDVSIGLGMTVCIMEDMTLMNNAGISFVIESLNNKFIVYNLTEGSFRGMVSAFNGAVERFAVLKAERNAK